MFMHVFETANEDNYTWRLTCMATPLNTNVFLLFKFWGYCIYDKIFRSTLKIVCLLPHIYKFFAWTFCVDQSVRIKVAGVVNFKLTFTDWFFYNLMILVMQNPIPKFRQSSNYFSLNFCPRFLLNNVFDVW